ncbi:MAG TPA: FixH family protein [Novosphingobium sp.]|nr:FixH family protein [Novosphingobium sp.]
MTANTPEFRPAKAPFRFTGRHMAAILVAFFGVVIVVNVYMATLASQTFSGVVVENSYDASQKFDTWLDEAAREKALGWQAKVERRADGHVAVTMTDKAGASLSADNVLSGEAWHPLGQEADRVVSFRRQADGSWLSFDALPAGRWRLRLRMQGRDGRHVWRGEERL